MHIPDGFLDAPTAVATAGISLGVVAYSVKRTNSRLKERAVPLLGVTAAFIFAAQMLNFPVAAGTSGHLLGAVLAAALMGPWAAVVILTVVLFVQAVGMADGGITALGANVLNMAVIGGLGGYGAFRLLQSVLPRSAPSYMVSVAVAAWLSVVAGAAAAAVELSASGTVPFRLSLPAMTSVHMIIGIGEALITATVLGAVLASRPDLVRTLPAYLKGTADSARVRPAAFGRRARAWSFVAAGLAVSLALAVLAAAFASDAPDGLERVAEDQGFAAEAADPVWSFSPLPDYALPGLDDPGAATAVAGALGVLVLFALIVLFGRWLSRTRDGKEGEDPPREAASLHGHAPSDHRHAGHTHGGRTRGKH